MYFPSLFRRNSESPVRFGTTIPSPRPGKHYKLRTYPDDRQVWLSALRFFSTLSTDRTNLFPDNLCACLRRSVRKPRFAREEALLEQFRFLRCATTENSQTTSDCCQIFTKINASCATCRKKSLLIRARFDKTGVHRAFWVPKTWQSTNHSLSKYAVWYRKLRTWWILRPLLPVDNLITSTEHRSYVWDVYVYRYVHTYTIICVFFEYMLQKKASLYKLEKNKILKCIVDSLVHVRWLIICNSSISTITWSRHSHFFLTNTQTHTNTNCQEEQTTIWYPAHEDNASDCPYLSQERIIGHRLYGLPECGSAIFWLIWTYVRRDGIVPSNPNVIKEGQTS